ncbi:MAG TPA: hypothetical protein VMZ04_06290 [Anaerolineae bacterium]|nr:hypothetical protein [Anaerolineae bacterium]
MENKIIEVTREEGCPFLMDVDCSDIYECLIDGTGCNINSEYCQLKMHEKIVVIFKETK